MSTKQARGRTAADRDQSRSKHASAPTESRNARERETSETSETDEASRTRGARRASATDRDYASSIHSQGASGSRDDDDVGVRTSEGGGTTDRDENGHLRT